MNAPANQFGLDPPPSSTTDKSDYSAEYSAEKRKRIALSVIDSRSVIKNQSKKYGNFKFDAILNVVVDCEKIDLSLVKEILHEHLTNEHTIMSDLIMDHIKRERYPDPKVLQCELNEFEFMGFDETKRLVAIIWSNMVDIQERFIQATKYRKTYTNDSTSRVSTTNTSHHYTSSQHGYYNQQSVDQCH